MQHFENSLKKLCSLAKHRDHYACLNRLSVQQFEALIQNLPKKNQLQDEQHSPSVETAIIYAGLILALYVCLLGLFISGSFRRMLFPAKTNRNGQRHVVTVNEDGPSIPTLVNHYPKHSEKAIEV